MAGLAGGSPGFFNPVRLVCFGAFFAPFFLGVLFGLLLCPRVCLRLLRTRSLSAFCAIPPTRLLAQALGVALLGFALGFGCLGYGWEGSFCLCRFFAPFCSPCLLRCSAQALGFGFFGLCFCPGVLWLGVGVTMHFFAWFFFAAVLLCSVFFFLQDLTTAEDEERTPRSGAAQWRGWLEGLLASPTR